MEIRRIFIVLVDISGYTRFIRKHRISLLHAERIITDLLETVIKESQTPLVLHELEGDAVNFYALSDGSPDMAQNIASQVLRFIDSFRARERELLSECGLCNCQACAEVGKLKMKAVLHHGEAAFTQVRQFEKIGGEDVILAHRLLKNSIPQNEYILLTRAFTDLAGELEAMTLESRREACEGIGEVDVDVHFTEPAEILPDPDVTKADRRRRLASFGAYKLRRLFRPSSKFKHLQGL